MRNPKRLAPDSCARQASARPDPRHRPPVRRGPVSRRSSTGKTTREAHIGHPEECRRQKSTGRSRSKRPHPPHRRSTRIPRHPRKPNMPTSVQRRFGPGDGKRRQDPGKPGKPPHVDSAPPRLEVDRPPDRTGPSMPQSQAALEATPTRKPERNHPARDQTAPRAHGLPSGPAVRKHHGQDRNEPRHAEPGCHRGWTFEADGQEVAKKILMRSRSSASWTS